MWEKGHPILNFIENFFFHHYKKLIDIANQKTNKYKIFIIYWKNKIQELYINIIK